MGMLKIIKMKVYCMETILSFCLGISFDKYYDFRIRVLFGIAIFCIVIGCRSGFVRAQNFNEGWENAIQDVYIPTENDDEISRIVADEGLWLIADTVSNFPEDLGPTPNRAEIFEQDGSKVLKLISEDGNVWILIRNFINQFNKGFAIPILPDTVISFEETGNITESFSANAFEDDNCLDPPCFQNISIVLDDNRGNMLAYVLQRSPDVTPVTTRPFYMEIFLDPDAGSYSRNVLEDFNTIPTFRTNGAEIRIIQFKIDQPGWGIIDNINISSTDQESVKRFKFNCRNKFSKGPGGLEKLSLTLGESESCKLKLINLEPGVSVEVSTNLRTGFRSSIGVSPISGITNTNGEIEFIISAIGEGIDWISWAVQNEEGNFEFSKEAYDAGSAWGMFVEVK